MDDEIIYHEVVHSKKTPLIFLVLACIALASGIGRLYSRKVDWKTKIFLFLGAIFSFYTINYRELEITLSNEALCLKFGLFSWKVPLENIAGCRLDVLPPLKRYGGAGIHFMFVDGRYRASFNFLEYPRVVVSLARPVGPVQDLSFSTRQPQELMLAIESSLPG